MTFKTYAIIVTFILLLNSAFSQSITDILLSAEGTSLAVTYKASNILTGSKYRIRLYSSIDAYAEPITKNTSGAVGDEVTLSPTNKILIKDPLTTLGNLQDPVEFKIEATLVYAPVVISNPKTSYSQKRGKSVSLEWKGGLSGDEVTFDLLKNAIVIQKDFYSQPANYGKAKVPLGKRLKLGGGYQLQMRVSSLDESYLFPEMKLKRKFSIFGRVFWTVAALSAADYYLNPNSFIRYEILGFRDPLPEAPSVPSN